MVFEQIIVKATFSVILVLSWGSCASAMYDPYIGRFASRDPVGYEASSLSLYQFLDARSLCYVDAMGDRGGPTNLGSCNGIPYNPMNYGCCDGKTIYSKIKVIKNRYGRRGGTNVNQCCKGDGTGTIVQCSGICGDLKIACSCGDFYVPVYVGQQWPAMVLGSGCMTFGNGISCTGDCDSIKTMMSGDNPKRSILDHEGCHYCAIVCKGICPYLLTTGGAPDGCVGNEVPTSPVW